MREVACTARAFVVGLRMDDYGPETYGDRMASLYDEMHGGVVVPTGSIDDTVEALERLAAGGPALELGIGTGRIAIPLHATGVDVSGIDASAAMVDRLHRKEGGENIAVTMGDFADVDVEGSFTLVYVVFNTLFNLLTQADQVRCFENVAAHLDPGGVFVVEAFVPDLGRFDRDQRLDVRNLSVDRVWLDASRHDPLNQRVDSQHIHLHADGRMEMRPVALRYAWPSELDLMARVAGLRLGDRWSNWNGTPFGNGDGFHISVYEKPVAGDRGDFRRNF